MIKNIFFSLFTLGSMLLLISCASAPKGTVINAMVDGSGNLQAFLDRFEMNNKNAVIQKVDIKNTGEFTFESEEKLQEGIYRIRIGSQRFYLFLDGTESKVDIKGNLTEMSKGNFEVSGSPATEEYNQVFNKYVNRQLGLNELKESIAGLDNPLAAFHLAAQAFRNDYNYLDVYTGVHQKLTAAIPESDYTKVAGNLVKSLEATKQQMAMKERIKVGELAPDIKLPSPDGKEYALSDLKGKVVLLDFWASWCRPCRMENPNVVKVYNQYNRKGFEVFSVSLDRPNGKNAWIAAIEKDGLVWPYHVSDLKYWNSAPAKMYGVSGIPKTFLIDKEGKIAEINPRGPKLEPAVKRLLG